MNPEIKSRLSKVYELVNHGATEGERQAAKLALDRLMTKYEVDNIDLKTLMYERCAFRYNTEMEIKLLLTIWHVLLEDAEIGREPQRYPHRKTVSFLLDPLERITVECAYEYFRRHMLKEWKSVCLPDLKRCRSAKGKKKRREALSSKFFTMYCVKSKLYREGELTERRITSDKELKDHQLLEGIEGGTLKKQLVTGHLLN